MRGTSIIPDIVIYVQILYIFVLEERRRPSLERTMGLMFVPRLLSFQTVNNDRVQEKDSRLEGSTS